MKKKQRYYIQDCINMVLRASEKGLVIYENKARALQAARSHNRRTGMHFEPIPLTEDEQK